MALSGVLLSLIFMLAISNTAENLMHWVRHPRQVRPDTAMPDTGVTEEDARHIAAYLYTLR